MYRWCLLIEGYFCMALNYAEKAELSKCSWYLKRKFGVTMHFSEIIKLKFGKKMPCTLLCILLFSTIIVALLSLKKCLVPPIFFLDSNSPC